MPRHSRSGDVLARDAVDERVVAANDKLAVRLFLDAGETAEPRLAPGNRGRELVVELQIGGVQWMGYHCQCERTTSPQEQPRAMAWR